VPADEPAPPSSKAIAAALQPFVDSQSLAGAVALVADKDHVLSIDAVGYADVGAKTPLIVRALFGIASQSKPITAAALMMLVDEGKVNLDDPVEKYLRSSRGRGWSRRRAKDPKELRTPKHPITVREILSHTSGLPFQTSAETPTLDKLSLRDSIASYAKTPLQYEPGNRMAIFQRGHQHRGPDYRGRQRHGVRGFHGQRPVRDRLA